MEEKEDIITIDFKALFKILWKEKLWILLITSVFTLGGIWYAFTAREEFVSEGKLLPEISGGGGNSLGGLANLVGIGGFELGMKNSTDAIRPDLYPNILKSTSFFINLLDEEFVNRNGAKVRFEKFYHSVIEKNMQIDEKMLIKPKGNSEGVIILNILTENRIDDLKNRIQANIDKSNGAISVSVKMPDPAIAADVARYAIEYMTTYITNYRTEKLKKEVDFLLNKVTLTKSRYYSNQERKAKYLDMFQAPTIRLQASDMQRERLESEYKISASVYNDLIKKLEESKLRLQQETPVFQISQIPIVPNYSSEPKKKIILIACFTFGIIFSFIFSMLFRSNYKKVIL
jgi:uncharacterized protein involved in exopolysaccharide biosynthesis